MMGIKARMFAPVEHLSLEELVPHDHFYRHLERVLDLNFVRELVAPYYAVGGRPSIDPVVLEREHGYVTTVHPSPCRAAFEAPSRPAHG